MYLESATEADYVSNIETLVDQGNDLIVACGFLMADTIKEAAEAYPDQNLLSLMTLLTLIFQTYHA